MAQAVGEAEEEMRRSRDNMPAYTRLPIIHNGHSRSLTQHLGFVSLQISHGDEQLAMR